MAAFEPEPAYDAAVAATLPPGTCPLLTRVHKAKVRDQPDGPWTEIEIPDGHPAEGILVSVMMGALNDGARHLDPASLQTDYRHIKPCPLCDHQESPGPRVWGLLHADASEAVGGERAPERRVQVFANADDARLRAEDYADAWTGHRRKHRIGRAEVLALTVPADSSTVSGMRLQIIGEDAELWLWDTRPAVNRQTLPAPDRILLIDHGTVTELTAHQARNRRPGHSPAPAHSAFQVVRDGTRELLWYDDGGQGVLVSVRDLTSTQPAVRVTRSGVSPLGDGVPGLTVYGTHLADRPPLSELATLAPQFADLARHAASAASDGAASTGSGRHPARRRLG